MRKKLTIRRKSLERVFSVFSLLLFSQALVPILRRGEIAAQGDLSGDSTMQLIYFTIYLITIFFLIFRFSAIVKSIKNAPIIWLLLAIACISVLWSGVPAVTFRRSIALIGSSIFGVYMGARFSIKEQVRIIFLAFLIAALLSIFVTVIFPDLGIMDRGKLAASWKGVYRHKNLLGRIMSLGVGLSMILILDSSIKIQKFFYFVSCLIFTALVFLSQSATGIILLAIMISTVLFLRITQKTSSSIPMYLSFVPLGMGILLLLSLESQYILGLIDGVFSMLGRDMTVTGRTRIWVLALEMIKEKPFLGYGYSGFWLGLSGPSEFIWNNMNWDPPHAHNGFLDLILDLGYLGLLLFFTGYTIEFYKSVRNAAWHLSGHALFPVTYLIFFFVSSLPESVILQQNDIYWVLFLSTIGANSILRREIGADESRES